MTAMRYRFLFKAPLLIICLVLFSHLIQAQSYQGPHLSQYDPLKATYFNPASLPQSEMRWQVNILSLDVHAGNNLFQVASLKGILKEFDPYDFFKLKMDGRRKYANINSDIRGPGFMFNFGKNSISVGTRIKEVASVNNLNEDLAYALFYHFDNLGVYLPSIKDEKLSISVNAYAEYSIAYARKLFSNDKHALSAGVNFKLLDKIFYGTLDGKNIQFDKNESFKDETVNVKRSEFDLIISDDLEGKKFKHDWGIDGWAIDAGVEYVLKSSMSSSYRLKVGLALNDFGTLKQKIGNNSFHFVGNNKDVPYRNIDFEDADYDGFKQVLDSLGTRTERAGKKDITLPSTLNAYVDFRILTKLFVYGGIQVNPYDFKKKEGLANLPTRLTLIPRFELKQIGVYAPIGWDKYEGFSTGVGVRLWQFSLGSSNIISSIAKNDYSGVNFFISTSIGGKRRLPDAKVL